MICVTLSRVRGERGTPKVDREPRTERPRTSECIRTLVLRKDEVGRTVGTTTIRGTLPRKPPVSMGHDHGRSLLTLPPLSDWSLGENLDSGKNKESKTSPYQSPIV